TPDGVSSSIPLVAVPLARSSLILWQAKWFTTIIPPFATLATEVNQAHAERTNTNRVAFMGASLRRRPPPARRAAYNVRDMPTSTKNSKLVLLLLRVRDVLHGALRSAVGVIVSAGFRRQRRPAVQSLPALAEPDESRRSRPCRQVELPDRSPRH